jgi:hypothetical protein
MSKPTPLILIVALAAILQGVSAANATPGASPVEATVRTITFRVFAAERIPPMEYEPTSLGDRKPVLFYPTAFSPRYVYKGEGPIRFFRRGVSAPVLELNPPPELNEIVIMWLNTTPGSDAGPLGNVRVLDDAVLHRPLGTASILNVSGLSLRGVWDGKPIAIDEGLSALTSRSSAGTLELRTYFKNRWYPSYRETIEVRQGERALLLLLPPIRRGSLEVQSRWLVDALN